MNVLITGGNGQLGKSIYDCSQSSTDNYIFTDIDSLDICNEEAINDAICKFSIDIIINCAAYTNVDRAEDDSEAAEKINAKAVANLAMQATKHHIYLFHISTDYIFDGCSNTPIPETATPNPLNAYGLSKLHGESAIADSRCKALIFRTAWLYSEYGHNFVKTMLKLIESKDELNVVVDQTGTPTYARNLARAIVNIISSRKYKGREGIYNFTDEGVCTWFDFAKHIAAKASGNNCRILPCLSSDFPTKAVRPKYSVLDKTKYKRSFESELPYWTDSLTECIDRLLDNNE